MTQTEQPASSVSIINLSKKFGSFPVLDDINLELEKGKIFALVGPNGAGKTTLLKLLTGLLAPTKGKILINGFDITVSPVEAKKQLAYIPDDPKAYDFLTGEEFLYLTGNLRGLTDGEIKSRLKNLSSLFPLSEIVKTRMAQYSRGNKQKVAFLAGLLAQPAIFFIDEPIVGLDPDSITTFGRELKVFAKAGGSVLFSTHILDFAKLYADQVGFLSRGKIIYKTSIKSQTSLEKLYHEHFKTAWQG